MDEADISQDIRHFLPHKIFMSGAEQFTFNKKSTGFTLCDYWSWAFSDIYNNIYRGIMAEYIVATALGITPPYGDFVRVVWNSYDLLSPGGKRVEVKSASFLQSWDGSPSDDVSKVIYGIAPARVYEDDTHKYGVSLQRNNDVYVFCLFKALSKDVSPLDLDFWDFYVLPTNILDKKKPSQKSISLSSLKKLNPILCKYDGLLTAIENLHS